jgi:hypothetical protein
LLLLVQQLLHAFVLHTDRGRDSYPTNHIG